MEKEFSLLREYLNSIEVSSGDEDTDESHREHIKDAFREIEGYCPKPVDLDSDIMEYWEVEKYKYPYLYKLAMLVHERDCSLRSKWF